jgi:hypothetical protein
MLGGGGNGQLGVGVQTTSTTPLQVSGLTPGSVANIFAGWRFTFAIAGGIVKAWGQNTNGQLGVNYKNGYELSPVTVTALAGDVTSISGGRYHACALASDTSVYCWGLNGNGQLGTNDTSANDYPIPAHTLGGWPPRDLTRDQQSDVVWHHSTTGEVWLWPMDGAARSAEQWVRTIPDTQWQIKAAADFDGDGTADLA